MQEMVRVRSADEYFQIYGLEGIGKKGLDRILVRQQLIDAFHKEMFGLVAMRTKKSLEDIPAEGDPEALRIARNVIKDTTKKWIKLVGMFEKYKETSGLLKPDDIALEIDDLRAKNMTDNGGTAANNAEDK